LAIFLDLPCNINHIFKQEQLWPVPLDVSLLESHDFDTEAMLEVDFLASLGEHWMRHFQKLATGHLDSRLTFIKKLQNYDWALSARTHCAYPDWSVLDLVQQRGDFSRIDALDLLKHMLEDLFDVFDGLQIHKARRPSLRS
jgi:hypothetical protein